MYGARRFAAVTAILLAAYGCASTDPTSCSQIGFSSGVSVLVSADAAPTLSNLTLDVCSGGTCHKVPVMLDPGSQSSPDDCPTASPDSVCSAAVVPDGTLVGFAVVDGLPVGPVQVSATATFDGKLRSYAKITVDASATYPNGPKCPAQGNQAHVEIHRTGLVG